MQAPNPALTAGLHSRGYLPHLKAEGRSYFVTFRIAGTLPKDKLLQFKSEREAIVQKAQAARRPLTRAESQELFRWYSSRVDKYLDQSSTNCWLQDARIAELVRNALVHFEGERYLLRAWVIMPNHIHAVLLPLAPWPLTKIFHSWKSFTSNKANEILNRTGPFWQRESYDHLIRHDEDLAHCIHYIYQNPVTAHLCAKPSEYRWSSAFAGTTADK